MAERERLPDRRQHTTVAFQHDGIDYIGRGARFADGRLAEVFMDGGAIGSSLYFMAKDAAVVLSLALQYGTPIDTIRAALSQEIDGTPRGPVGKLLALMVAADA